MTDDREWIKTIVDLLGIIMTLIGIMVSNKKTIVAGLCVLACFFSAIIFYRHIQQIRYIRFVEYLISNKPHSFALLPKIRMYLQIAGKNSIDIGNMCVMYTITSSDENDEKSILGDMTIEYKIQILNKNLPNKFQFIYSNDASVENTYIGYKFGDEDEYQPLPPNVKELKPYWRGTIKLYDIGLEKNKLPQGKYIYLHIKASCNKAFDFYNLGRDTTIFLPMAYGRKIHEVRYEIDVSDFKDRKFYCNAWRIHERKLKYDRSSIECKRNSNGFVSVFAPSTIHGEQAYYFRIGLSEDDIE